MRNPRGEEAGLGKPVINCQQQTLGNISISGCNPKVVVCATTSIKIQYPLIDVDHIKSFGWKVHFRLGVV
jgi:hypothetical protein